MTRAKGVDPVFSRRAFLEKMRWAPLLFLPAPLQASPFGSSFPGYNPSNPSPSRESQFPFADFQVTPHYPAKSPVDDLLRLVVPGSDGYVTEKYAFEIGLLLKEWSRGLKESPPAMDILAKFLAPAITASSLTPIAQKVVRTGQGIEVLRRQFSGNIVSGREGWLREIKNDLASLSRLETAEFEIIGIQERLGTAPTIQVEIRYDLVGLRADTVREERIGHWLTEWTRNADNEWRAVRWEAREETVSRARGPVFQDVTAQSLGETESYKNQLLHGVDSWRTVLDGACGIDVYGNNGVAVGDFDNDGFDDLYVCQPAGLPNRLYRNRGDGTFEDVTKAAGVDVLDGTACALFADFENKGLQDLLVVCGSGPLLFVNQGNGKFQRKSDAFKFVRPPQGTFTHAAVADYDGDGRLDIYFCLYSYYLGLDQYHYPAPYFDARNGPPNFLLHNEGNATFQDRTEEAGLNVENDRYSFACAWGDANGDGAPDLYVVNDFGRSNLYHNQGDGTFRAVSSEAGVDEPGAGMSACWVDFDNDGNQDLYAANMWSAAGLRVSEQPQFREKDTEQAHSMYRRHAGGNSLYRNRGNGQFERASISAGAALGRWAWSSDSWDFDHDGYPDLYIANGYISGPKLPGTDQDDLSSFFWRQVVAKSPQNPTPSVHYELGWNAINELIRSDFSWSGRERNVLLANNRDGTFSEVSGAVGMDFLDDSRSFALADLDHDGRLEVVLKNRTAPQLRVLRNAMAELGGSVALRLRGVKSNRDAIGAAVTVEAAGHRQTKYLQAGSGFLSQHSKELFFGVGETRDAVRVSIRWPSGLKQVFERVPVNQRIELQEGQEDFRAVPFTSPLRSIKETAADGAPTQSPIETWLIDPLFAPEFSLPDLSGTPQRLSTYRGTTVLLSFWASSSAHCRDQLRNLQKSQSALTSNGIQILGVAVDDASNAESIPALANSIGLTFPNVVATPEVTGTYNIIYRYLFDRRRDLSLPTSFLINADGMIVKLYQGVVDPASIAEDLRSLPVTPEERLRKALPFEGTLHLGSFQRNAFTYGVAFFQRGYLGPAEAAFRQVIAAKPDDAEAYYNLGTLCLRRNALPDARQNLLQTVKLRPNYPEAWNNLGMLAAQEGNAEEAIRNFQTSLQQRPDYAIALLNLGNVYRRQGSAAQAEKSLKRVLELEPENAEGQYSLGMFYVRQEQLDLAKHYLQEAIELKPDYPDALNNLGVLFVRGKNFKQAEEQFQTCIRVAPAFDQSYLNLARLYVILEEKEKARETLRALLRQRPDHKVARETLEMLD